MSSAIPLTPSTMPATISPLAPNLWLMPFPLKALGVDLHRNVSLIRLESGKLIVHSTAPFSESDVAAIKALGNPEWLVDSLLRHDTFAKEGRAAFPEARYFAPPGFSTLAGIATENLVSPPSEWAGEIEVAAIDGAPDFGEVVMLHQASRTLIVADLVINFERPAGLWARLLLLLATVGGRHQPGFTRPFKHAIKDFAAFKKSIDRVLAWDFDRIIVGHGEPIETGGREKLRKTVELIS